MSNPGLEALAQQVTLLRDLAARKRERMIDFFQPYEKQAEFITLGVECRERCLMAGNQQGKTFCGAFEMACHLTGQYPDWWRGRVFDHPIRAWAAGESSGVVRDVQQKLLLGLSQDKAAMGTGMIPRSTIQGQPTMARGISGAVDTVVVEHRTNGVVDGNSYLTFKSYEQGRLKFQGDTLDLVWCDEEPDYEIYSECLTRVSATEGMVYLTFTPLKGASTVVLRFMDEPTPDRQYVVMTIHDAKHISPEQRAKIIAGYKPHERDARILGIPMMGEGRVFPYAESRISEPPIPFDLVPQHWTKLWSIDFGIDHPFAAVLMAWDRDADVIHVLHAIRMKDGIPIQHAVPIKSVAANVRIAWPHDGTNRDKGSGEQLASLYKKQEVLMLPDHATFEDGGISFEAGLLEMSDRFETERLKVGANLTTFFEEYRTYHRKKGLVVKERDDILSAVRIGIMAKRFGRPGPFDSLRGRRRPQTMANDVDFDLS